MQGNCVNMKLCNLGTRASLNHPPPRYSPIGRLRPGCTSLPIYSIYTSSVLPFPHAARGTFCKCSHMVSLYATNVLACETVPDKNTTHVHSQTHFYILTENINIGSNFSKSFLSVNYIMKRRYYQNSKSLQIVI